ncbi:MAG: putative Ig domain-containing protein, partial [Acidobacteria bacterium]|nr:putative Ig domain-containing protein [Acidobacteriota bacterium]
GVTANITTTCAATTATFALIVTDNQNVTGTGTLTVTVTPNTPPVLSYNAATVTAGTTPTFLPVAGPSDNGAVNPLVLQGVAPNNGGLVISLNAATGQVTVLSAALIGNYTVTVTATDNCGATTTATLPITVVCPTITVNPASLPGATVNTAYAQSLTASPAGGNYTFAVTSGLLPAGLTLNANGSFSGAPTQSGTFNFRLTASGFGGCTGFRDYTLVATCPTITLTPASLPGGTVGTAYSQAVSASPAGSYSYAVSSGALPTGLTLNASTGAITGTPTTNGSFTFTIRASAGACNGSSSYSVTIACPTITLGALANGQAGISYSQTISVSPAGSYTFAILTGNLPSGLSLNTATGVISGLPTVTGTYSFTLRAQTAGGCNGTQSYALVITCPTVTLSPASLPNGTVGTAYSQSLAASPAGGNYTYAVTSGALPAGLSLNLATGLLSGTPSSSGTFTFRITASGFGGCTGFRDYTLVISGGGCPTITLPATLPNGGVGTLYNNSVAASPSGSYSYTATGSLPPGVTLYGSGLLFGYPTTPGSYTFTITATQGACTGTQSYTVLVSAGAFAPLDFDGDRKSELLTRQGNAWTLTLSQSGLRETYTLGEAEDQAAFGDYDGDGRVDLAVYCPTAAHWLIRLSSTGVTITRQLADLLPSATLLPVTADFDGDGITDLALFDAATAEWQVERSHDGKRLTWQFGAAADVPVAADYDGDGKADLAVYQRATGTWLIRQSSDGVELNRQFGGPKDQPLPGDYDGDGKADLAVWRTTEATLYLSQSATQQMTRWAVGLSSTNDWVLPGDFDGDGKLELAVWRGAVGTWFIWQSATQDYRLVVWGTTAAPFRN